MEAFDQQKAQRVWARVNSGDCRPDSPDLVPLLCQELTDAAALLRLAKRLGGHGGPLLRLSQQCRQRAGYLRGICALTDGSDPAVAVPAMTERNPQAILQKCYVNSLHRLRAYESMASSQDYGPVFQSMARSMGPYSASLLALIGKVTR